MVDIEYRTNIKDLPADERPRERLALHGESALNKAELIAIALRTGTKKDNAIALARHLLHEFRDLQGIARASVRELCQVPGIGPAKAAQIKAAIELGRRAMLETGTTRPQITSPRDAASLVMPSLCQEKQEQMWILLLDTKHRVMRQIALYRGTANSSPVRIAEVFQEAVRDSAVAIVMAHNHPSGDPTPSPEDIEVTREAVRAGDILGIKVLDHLIIGDSQHEFVSLKEKGLGF